MNYKKRQVVTYIASFISIFTFNIYIPLHAQILSDIVLIHDASQPHIALDNQSNIHVVWNDDWNIRYGIFNSMGNKITEPYTFAASSHSPGLAINNGRAVAICRHVSPAYYSNVIGQIFNDGSPERTFEVTAYNINHCYSPDICFLNDSTFIIVWCGDVVGPGVFGQIITTSMRYVGPELVLCDRGSIHVSYGSSKVVKQSSNGDFFVICRDNNTGSNKVYGRLFYDDGTPQGPDFLISEDPNLTDVWFAEAEITKDGDFAVVWGGKIDTVWQVQWRWFENDGTPYGSSETITTASDSVLSYSSVDISIDDDNKGVISWEQEINGYSRIYAQRFLPDKTYFGGSYRVSNDTEIHKEFNPSVILSDGRIYTAWQQHVPGTEISAVMFNILDFNDPTLIVEKGTTQNIPESFRLFQNFPNPFNAQTTISYELPAAGSVRLTIHDILGKEVITLIDEVQSLGLHRVLWNGKDSKGGDATSGIYLYNLRWRGEIQRTGKMIVSR